MFQVGARFFHESFFECSRSSYLEFGLAEDGFKFARVSVVVTGRCGEDSVCILTPIPGIVADGDRQRLRIRSF